MLGVVTDSDPSASDAGTLTIWTKPLKYSLVSTSDVATNVYTRTPTGWRLLAHHAAPTPTAAAPAKTPRAGRLH